MRGSRRCSSPGAVEALARADGYVYPGETPLSAHVAQDP